MLYEPYRKTCYRFPSEKSITELDTKLYFPDKPSFSEEDIRFVNRITSHVPERKIYQDL